MDSSFVGKMLDDFFKSLVAFFICAVLGSALITGVVVYTITKRVNDPERAKYHETVKSLTSEQRKVLGL